VSLEPNALDDVWNDIRRVAGALGAPDRGEALVARLRERMDAIARRTALLARPRIACIEWIEPLMACGNWMPELVARAGGDNRFGEAGKHSPWMTFADLCREDPDVILVVPCGFDVARTRQEMPALTGLDGWSELAAVRAGRVFLADGNRFFNRPGPRLVESLEMLAEMLHPEELRFGHEGDGWVRLG
jgi:iron complex transport system substrate-binding protein